MSLPPPPRDRSKVRKASMPDAPAAAAAALSTTWTDSYTRRPRRPATIPVERQAGLKPFDNVWDPSRQTTRSQSGSRYQQPSAAGTKSTGTMSRPYPTPLQQHQSAFEYDQFHPQQAAYDRQQQPYYQAYHPSFQAVDYKQQSSQQQELQAPPTPWPGSLPRALQMRRDSSRTLAPTMAPATLDSGTELATRSFSLPIPQDAVTRGEFGSLVTRGGGSGRVPPAVAMMVVMDSSGERGALQTYSGSTLDGYNYGRHNSTDSRASVSKSVLAPPVASHEVDADAAKRHRAERRRFRIMASLGTITAIATVVLAVFTALNFYSKVNA